MGDDYQHARERLTFKAIGAHARGDWQAEREALDALHLMDFAEREATDG